MPLLRRGRAVGGRPSLSAIRQRRPATAARESEAGPFQPKTEGEAIESPAPFRDTGSRSGLSPCPAKGFEEKFEIVTPEPRPFDSGRLAAPRHARLPRQPKASPAEPIRAFASGSFLR
jgi:hypothetical protein